MPVEVKMDKERKCIVIELPVEKPRPSASGKTTLIASTHGLVAGDASYSGRSVVVVANAFVYPDEPSNSEKSQSRKRQRRTLASDLDQSARAHSSKNERTSPTKTVKPNRGNDSLKES